MKIEELLLQLDDDILISLAAGVSRTHPWQRPTDARNLMTDDGPSVPAYSDHSPQLHQDFLLSTLLYPKE